MARTKSTPFWSYPATSNNSLSKPSTSTPSQAPAEPASLGRSDSVKFGRNGDPVVPAGYQDLISKSKYYDGKAYSTTPARATDEEIEDDVAPMRETCDGKPYVKPASPQEVLPELDNYGYKGRIVKKPKSKLESDIRNGPPTGEELVHRNQAKDEEAGLSTGISDTRGEPLNTNERFRGRKFRGDGEESSVTMSDARYKTFLGKEVFQPNQAPGEEGESLVSKSDSPRVPLMKKVAQNSQFKVNAVQLLLEACNANDDPSLMNEVVQDNQIKDKGVGSSVARDTPTGLAPPITYTADTGIPATSKKRKISDVSELTNDSLTSPLDEEMPQAEDEEGPPHKKLRTSNGAVNLPIPPENPAIPKVISARTKKLAVRKSRQSGSGKGRKTVRAFKASSVVNRPAAKAAAPVVPVRAESPSANVEKPAGEPAIVSKSVAVVIITRAASKSNTWKDKSPTTTDPGVEDSTDGTTDQEDKASTSSEDGDDLEKDRSYTPVAPRKRRVVRKRKAPVAPRKRATPHKPVTSKEEENTVQQEDKSSVVTPEVDAGLEIGSTKPTAVSRSRGVKRKVTGLEDKITIQEETGAPVTHGVGAGLITKTPAPAPPKRVRRKATVPKDAIIEPLITPTENTALATESGKSDKPPPRPRKRARTAVNIPEGRDIVGEGIQQLVGPEADVVRKTQKPARVPTRRPPRGKATAPEEAITGAISTPAEIGTILAKEKAKPAACPKRRGGKANAPEAEATAKRKARPPASHDVDASLTKKPTPAPLGGNAKRKAMAPAEAATRRPTATNVNPTLAEIAKPVAEASPRWRRNVGSRAVEVIHPDTGLGIDNTKPSAATRSRGVKRKATTQLEYEVVNQQEAEPAPTPVVHASRAVKITKLAPTPKRSVRETVTAQQDITTASLHVPKADAVPAQGSAKPAAGTRKRRKKTANTPEVGATVHQKARPPTAPKVDPTPTTKKPTPAPTTGSPPREIAVSEERVPRPAVSETLAGAAEAATPATTSTSLAPVRRPRYRTPAEGSRKSTRIKSQHNKLK